MYGHCNTPLVSAQYDIHNILRAVTEINHSMTVRVLGALSISCKPHAVEPSYNDIGSRGSTSRTSDTVWYQLIRNS